MLGVRIIGSTAGFGPVSVGSTPTPLASASIAQLAERLFCNQKVVGSIPTVGL